MEHEDFKMYDDRKCRYQQLLIVLVVGVVTGILIMVPVTKKYAEAIVAAEVEAEVQQILASNGIESSTITRDSTTSEEQVPANNVKEQKNKDGTATTETETQQESTEQQSSEMALNVNVLGDITVYEEEEETSTELEKLKEGDKIVVTAEADNGWLKVKHDDVEGYIYYLYTDYADRKDVRSVNKIEYPEGTIGKIIGEDVVVTNMPGEGTEVIETLSNDDKITIISHREIVAGEKEGWYQVQTESDNEGYIYGEYVFIDVGATVNEAIKENNKTESEVTVNATTENKEEKEDKTTENKVTDNTATENKEEKEDKTTENKVTDSTATENKEEKTNNTTECKVTNNTATENKEEKTNSTTESKATNNAATENKEEKSNNTTESKATNNTATDNKEEKANSTTESKVTNNTATENKEEKTNSTTESKATNNTATENKEEKTNSTTKNNVTNNTTTGIDITIKNQQVIMYKEANINSEEVVTINPGSKLTNAVEAGRGFLKAKYGNKEGYVYYLYTDYAEKANKKAVVKSTETSKAVVSADRVNLREAPGITTKIEDCLEKNTELEVISFSLLIQGEAKGWFEVKDVATGKTGYMYGQYVHVGVDAEEEDSKKDSQLTDNSTTIDNSQLENVSDADITLLAKVMVAEAGNCGEQEMKYVGQVLINRVNINNSSMETELSRDGQYPTTWSKIKSGAITATDEARQYAKELLNGENGFEGSEVAQEDWNKVYFQGNTKLGTFLFFSGYHYYGK